MALTYMLNLEVLKSCRSIKLSNFGLGGITNESPGMNVYMCIKSNSVSSSLQVACEGYVDVYTMPYRKCILGVLQKTCSLGMIALAQHHSSGINASIWLSAMAAFWQLCNIGGFWAHETT